MSQEASTVTFRAYYQGAISKEQSEEMNEGFTKVLQSVNEKYHIKSRENVFTIANKKPTLAFFWDEQINGKTFIFFDDHNKEGYIKAYAYEGAVEREAFKQMRMDKTHPYSTHRLEMAAPSEWAGEVD